MMGPELLAAALAAPHHYRGGGGGGGVSGSVWGSVIAALAAVAAAGIAARNGQIGSRTGRAAARIEVMADGRLSQALADIAALKDLLTAARAAPAEHPAPPPPAPAPPPPGLPGPLAAGGVLDRDVEGQGGGGGQLRPAVAPVPGPEHRLGAGPVLGPHRPAAGVPFGSQECDLIIDC